MPLFGKNFAASIFLVLYDNITPYIKFGAFVRCVNVTQKFSLKLPYYIWSSACLCSIVSGLVLVCVQ